MDFAALQAELLARGFDALSPARAGQFINDAVTEVDGLADWPYLQKEATGVSPLAITDLARVDTVVGAETGTVLAPASFETLVEWCGGDLSTAGDPAFYYVAWPSGVPEVATYPSSSDSIVVAYYRVSPVLSAAGDTPLAPSRFHFAYLAVASRLAENDSEGDVSRWQAEADRGVQAMMDALLPDQVAGSYQHVAYQSEDW